MASCCGNNAPGDGNPQGAPARAAAFNAGDVPDNMVLMVYLGGNLGTTLWGGPGGTPSGRYYTFGAGENDRIKHVDQRDVDWFLDRRENKHTLFGRYEEPAPSDVDQLAQAIASDLLKEAKEAAQDSPESGEQAPPVEEAKEPSEEPTAAPGDPTPVGDEQAPKVDTDQSTDAKNDSMLARENPAPVGDELAGIVEIKPEEMKIVDLPDAKPAPSRKRRH